MSPRRFRKATLVSGLLAMLGTLPCHAAQAQADVNGCPAAIEAASRTARIPAGLLASIGLVESGRPDPVTRRAQPWPWTVNVAGVGSYYPTKSEAIAAVQAAQATGVRSIDVGCMQVNLLHHPDAFASLDQAFDPAANATYAAAFLGRLFASSRSWPEAAASYHSQTPGQREDYQRRVMVAWPDSARYGGAVVAAATGHGLLARAEFSEAAANRARWVAMGIVRPAGRDAARPPLRLARLSQTLPARSTRDLD